MARGNQDITQDTYEEGIMASKVVFSKTAIQIDKDVEYVFNIPLHCSTIDGKICICVEERSEITMINCVYVLPPVTNMGLNYVLSSD